MRLCHKFILMNQKMNWEGIMNMMRAGIMISFSSEHLTLFVN
jgi:hypothetical protein